MSNFSDSRKRSREDEICGEVPLSKRINNLHLTNFDETQHSLQQQQLNWYENNEQLTQPSSYSHQAGFTVRNESEVSQHYQQQQQQPHSHPPIMPTTSQFVDSYSSDHTISNSTIGANGVCRFAELRDNLEAMGHSYQPELSREENPYYYVSNKLLHQLHFERVRRSNI